MKLRNKINLAFMGYGIFFGAVLGAAVVNAYYFIEDSILDKFLTSAIAQTKQSLATNVEPTLAPGFTLYQDELSAPEPWAGLELGIHEVEQYKHVAVNNHPVTGQRYFLVLDETQAGLDELLRSILVMTAIALASALAVGAILAILLSRHLMRPLDILVQRINSLDPNDPSLTPLQQDDEIGFLSDRLSKSIESVRAHSKREHDFTRFASHELRSPITVIRGSAAILLNDKSLPDKARRAATRIADAGRRTSRLVEAFLHLSREKVSPNKQIVTAASIEDDIRSIEAFQHSPVMEVTITNKSINQAVETDQLLLSIVLENLITNAAQHGDNSLSVQISLPAISLTNSISELREPGHGFGLEIAERICERLGIDLKIDDNGRTFVSTLMFPVGDQCGLPSSVSATGLRRFGVRREAFKRDYAP